MKFLDICRFVCHRSQRQRVEFGTCFQTTNMVVILDFSVRAVFIPLEDISFLTKAD